MTLKDSIWSLVMSLIVLERTLAWSSDEFPRFSPINFSSIAESISNRCDSLVGSIPMSRLRTLPLASTTNGAHDIPRNPGPTLPLPTETNGGISRSGT